MYALRELKHSNIPKQILLDVFSNKKRFGNRRFYSAMSYESIIRTEVLEDRVIPDCQLTTGKDHIIALKDCVKTRYTASEETWTVPSKIISGRSIIKVYGLIKGNHEMQQTAFQSRGGGHSTVSDMARRLLETSRAQPVVSENDLEILSEETILSQRIVTSPENVYLFCSISYDTELSDIPKSMYKTFAELVEHAVKAYIYSERILDLDQAVNIGGRDLNNYTRLVEEYADANELYKETRVRWNKQLSLADPRKRKRHIRKMVGGNL